MTRPWIFIHVAKTGGTSVRRAIGALHRMHSEGLFPGGRGQHDTLEELRAKMANPRAWEQAFKFAFVRNPYDRAVSAYCFHRQERATVGGMVAWFADMEEHRKRRDQKGLPWTPIMRPQWQYVTAGDGFTRGFVGRFEALKADLAEVVSQAGLAMVEPLGRHHASKGRDGRHYREFLDAEPEARAIVERWYARDLTQFGYTY